MSLYTSFASGLTTARGSVYRKEELVKTTSSCSLFVQHERILTGASPQRALIAGKRPAGGKGVYREVESEGSPRQTSGLTYRNHI